MGMASFELHDHVAVMTLDGDENRFNPDFLNAFFETLDAIENETEAATLVVRSAHEKIFSNGIDLEWLVPIIRKGDTETAKTFFLDLNRLFRRTLTSPLVTVAAIGGHAFAGGAIWSCAFDFRFMRSDRGYFCFPEVDLGIPFLPGMLALLKKAIPMPALERLHHLGVRLTAEECERERIVLKACHIDTLMDETLAFAAEIRKKRAIVAEMKRRFHKDVLHAIDVEDLPYIESGVFHIG
jgi:Delta3-Delta2-enoyl-CoA isomerase